MLKKKLSKAEGNSELDGISLCVQHIWRLSHYALYFTLLLT